MGTMKGRLTTEILSALYEHGELSLSELAKAINGNWETVLRRVEEFRAEGLIHSEKSKRFPFRRIIRLTNKGRKMAFLAKFGLRPVEKECKVCRERVDERVIKLESVLFGERKIFCSVSCLLKFLDEATPRSFRIEPTHIALLSKRTRRIWKKSP